MKTKMLLAGLLLANVFTLQAQHQMGDREKMKIFEGWAGRWEGEGWMQMGPGEPKKAKVEEQITPKLDGLVYLVEGVGKALNPETHADEIVHQAVAMLSYDKYTGQYKFRTHVKSGHSTDAWFNVISDGKYQWGFDIPNRGKIRYTITVDAKAGTWNEVGEYAQDGNTWMKNFEMNLTKVE